MLNRKLKLAPYVIKKKEENLQKICFYNAKDKTFSNLDYPTGIMITALDGSLTVDEVLDVLVSNNRKIETETFKASLVELFNLLYKEGFLVELL